MCHPTSVQAGCLAFIIIVHQFPPLHVVSTKECRERSCVYLTRGAGVWGRVRERHLWVHLCVPPLSSLLFFWLGIPIASPSVCYAVLRCAPPRLSQCMCSTGGSCDDAVCMIAMKQTF